MEVVVSDAPGVILFQTVHHNSVRTQVRYVRESVIARVFVGVYNLEIIILSENHLNLSKDAYARVINKAQA